MDAKETIAIQATINARVEKVWELYTVPEHVTHWNHASDDWHTTKAENDCTPGGKFLYRMEAKDGSSGFDFYGTYDEIETNELIVYTLDDGRKARVTFTGSQDETCIEVKFEAEGTHSVDMQRSGWQAILDNFKTYVEGNTMTKFNPYLNFAGNTEEAFAFYQSVFGGEFVSFTRYKDLPIEGFDLPQEAAEKIMHVGLPIGQGQMLMGTDALESLGQSLVQGNNVRISIHPGSKDEADRLFAALSQGGKVHMPMADQPWGDYYGDFQDQFGVHWMVNYHREE